MLALDAGDELIAFEPFYENYGPDAILSGATPRFVTLRPPDWSFDPDELRHAITVFLELCREHIQLEESIIYPEAKAIAAKLARRRATLAPPKFTAAAPSSS